jgi:hypothetical protein
MNPFGYALGWMASETTLSELQSPPEELLLPRYEYAQWQEVERHA